jgi:hypothetical protein
MISKWISSTVNEPSFIARAGNIVKPNLSTPGTKGSSGQCNSTYNINHNDRDVYTYIIMTIIIDFI